jgi:large subunit ribosomal protein L6
MVEKNRRVVPIPEGVSITKTGNVVRVEGPLGILEREFSYPRINVEIKDNEVVVETDSKRRRYIAMVGTYASHIHNMIKGVTQGFSYELKVVYSHFPIQISVKGNLVEVSNFLGERHPRYARIVGDTNVEVRGDRIVVSGINKEEVGQTAANIEQATRVRGLDVRVFQDGVYIVSRGE